MMGLSALEAMLIVVVLLLIAVLILACRRIETLYAQAAVKAEDSHADCTETILLAVGNRQEANVLRLAANAWMAPAEQAKRQRWLHEEMSKVGGSVPTLPIVERWLFDRAEEAARRG